MADLHIRDLTPIVEMQAVELKRLMRDKDRLNKRIDTLIEELSRLREAQQQDLGLREREQALRIQMQDTVNDLIQRAVVGPEVIASTPAEQPENSRGLSEETEKTTLVRRSSAGPARGEGKEIGIPAFLMADSLEKTGGGEVPPIRKLMTRIKARQA